LIGLILLKVLAKMTFLTAKSTAVKKASIGGIVIASGLQEINRDNRYNKPKAKFKNKEYEQDEEEIKLI